MPRVSFAEYLRRRRHKREYRRTWRSSTPTAATLRCASTTTWRPTRMVLDLGGYEGQWASDLYARRRCRIDVFEPVARFAAAIAERFRHNSDIRVHTLRAWRLDAQRNLERVRREQLRVQEQECDGGSSVRRRGAVVRGAQRSRRAADEDQHRGRRVRAARAHARTRPHGARRGSADSVPQFFARTRRSAWRRSNAASRPRIGRPTNTASSGRTGAASKVFPGAALWLSRGSTSSTPGGMREVVAFREADPTA